MSKIQPLPRSIESSKQILYKRFKQIIERLELDNEVKEVFLRQIIEDLEDTYTPIDFSKNAYVKIVDKKLVLNNFSRGIQYHEQLKYYIDHFNATLEELVKELKSNETFGIKEEELDFIKDEYSSFGKAYQSPFKFQGDPTHSRPYNLNFHSVKYTAPTPEKPSNEAFGAFCRMVMESGIMNRNEYGSNEAFVKDVFRRFQILNVFGIKSVPQRAWKVEFTVPWNEKSKREVEEKILPKIDENEKLTIASFLKK